MDHFPESVYSMCLYAFVLGHIWNKLWTSNQIKHCFRTKPTSTVWIERRSIQNQPKSLLFLVEFSIRHILVMGNGYGKCPGKKYVNATLPKISHFSAHSWVFSTLLCAITLSNGRLLHTDLLLTFITTVTLSPKTKNMHTVICRKHVVK